MQRELALPATTPAFLSQMIGKLLNELFAFTRLVGSLLCVSCVLEGKKPFDFGQFDSLQNNTPWLDQLMLPIEGMH